MRKMHGMKHHKLYSKWIDIKNRCTNANNKVYHNYGARGIAVSDEWMEDFKAFHDYVTQLPNYGEEGMTLDRINNNGDYEPGNVRWVDRHIQASNRGLKGNNTTGYSGIDPIKTGYMATLTYKGKKHYIKACKSIIDAVWARNNYIIDNELWEYPLQSI